MVSFVVLFGDGWVVFIKYLLDKVAKTLSDLILLKTLQLLFNKVVKVNLNVELTLG